MSTSPDPVDELEPDGDELEPDADEAELEEPDADEAELEEPDADEAGEPVEAEALGPTPEDLARLEREHTRHEKAVGKIMGQAFRYFALCPQCDGLGFAPVPPSTSSDVPQDPYLERCERCSGYGAVRTGARESAMHTVPCPACSGQGYTQKAEHPEVQPMPLAPAPANGPRPLLASTNPEAAAAIESLRAAGYVVVDPPAVAAVPGT